MENPELTVVVPVYRNARTVASLVARLGTALAGRTWELVAVDDAGGDGSVQALLEAADREGIRVRVIRHPANLGQNAAVLSGLAAARGRTMVVMDADLQDPPERVPALLEALDREAVPLALGYRTGRWSAPLEILTGRLYKALLFRLLGSPFPARVGLFLAMRAPVRDRLLRRARAGDYLLAHLAALGEPFTLVAFDRPPRPGGGSGYGFRRRLALAARGLALGWRLRARPFLPLHALGCAAVAGVLGSLQALTRPFGLSDDGFRWLLSAEWARGGGLYDRFQLLYPLGQYVWYGSWIAALGEHLASLRLAQGALTGLAAGLLARPVARAAGLPAAWGLALALGAVGTGTEKLPAAAAVLAAFMGLATARESGPGRVAGLGFASGLLLGWREDTAVLLGGVALLAALAAPGRLRRAAAATAGVLAGFGAWGAVAAWRGQAGAFLHHELWRMELLGLRLTPGGRTQLRWELPGGISSPRDLLIHALPLVRPALPVLYSVLLVWGLVRWRKGRGGPAVPLAAAAALALLPQFLWERPDFWHLREHLPALLVLLAVAGGAHPRLRRLVAPLLVTVAVAAAVLLGLQRRAEPSTPYPAEPGRALGIRLVEGAPPWAGLPRRPGETLVALPWCPGWYAAEGLPAGTRHLSAQPRHRDLPGLEAALAADLARPTNRWVILGPAVHGTGGRVLPPAARRVLWDRYRPLRHWRGFVLWERRVAQLP